MEEVKRRITEFLAKYFKINELHDREDILTSGIVNSLFAMQLIIFLEKEFNIMVENTDLDMKNFQSVQAIADFVTKKRVENPELL
jgi:acyl carrier protein